MLGLHCCIDFSLVAEIRGYSLVAVHEVLTAVASLAVEQGSMVLKLQESWLPGSRAQAHCGAWA